MHFLLDFKAFEEGMSETDKAAPRGWEVDNTDWQVQQEYVLCID